MPSWKLVIEYDGTRYHGWQEQKNARTIAGEIRGAASAALESEVALLGAGRTDRGVHALAQVARLDARPTKEVRDLAREMNERLPSDIHILRAESAPARFDPRRDALERSYLYQIALRRTAFSKRYVWWVRDRLDEERMRAAAALLGGRRDFSAFAETRGEEGSPIVHVVGAELAREGDLLLFRIVASHFLWKMVRRLVGALVEIGRGRLDPAVWEALLQGASARARPGWPVAAHTAPPSGLFLERVMYEASEAPGPLRPAFPVDSRR